MTYKTAYQQYRDYLSSAAEYVKNGGALSFFEFQQKGLVNEALLPPPGSMFKETFWAEIKERWPGEFERFTAWIDEYKTKINWNNLFCIGTDGIRVQASKDSNYVIAVPKRDIKFHDLPPAMQIGIFMQYCIEETHRYEFLEGQPKSMAKLVDLVKEWFCEEHEQAVRDHQNGKYMDDFDHNAE